MTAQSPVVALVASAGGVAALRTVLAGLPADFPVPVVVLQHLDPGRSSQLAAVLHHVSVLPVEVAKDGDSLRPGRVLVAPPGLHTLVTPNRRISLVLSGALPPSRPWADLLLTSLALAVAQGAVAVVLTGGGQDGATGATVVHKHGGTVLTTDKERSQAFAMPSATIDRHSIHPAVLPLESLAEALTHLVLRMPSDRPRHTT